MYRAPVEEIAFTLKHVAGLREALAAGAFGDLREELIDAVLPESGRFACCSFVRRPTTQMRRLRT